MSQNNDGRFMQQITVKEAERDVKELNIIINEWRDYIFQAKVKVQHNKNMINTANQEIERIEGKLKKGEAALEWAKEAHTKAIKYLEYVRSESSK